MRNGHTTFLLGAAVITLAAVLVAWAVGRRGESAAARAVTRGVAMAGARDAAETMVSTVTSTASSPALGNPQRTDLRPAEEIADRLLDALACEPIDREALRELASNGEGDADARVVDALLQALDRAAGDPEAEGLLAGLLGSLPPAEDEVLVSQLAQRLCGDVDADLPLLQAIARQGGAAAGRVLVGYLRAHPEAAQGPEDALMFDLAHDPEAVGILTEALGRTTGERELVSLIRLASQSGAEGMVPALVTLSEGVVSDGVLAEATRALARIGTLSAVDEVLSMTARGDARGPAAVVALDYVDDATPEASHRLVQHLTDRNPAPATQTRVALLNALGRMREPSAAGAMAEALADPCLEVRIAAARGLGCLGPHACPYADRLWAIYRDGGEEERNAVVISLGLIGGPTAQSSIEEVLQDTAISPSLRRNARRALKQVRRRDAP